jgi:hypothetical protein
VIIEIKPLSSKLKRGEKMILSISVALTLTLLLFALYAFYSRDSEIMNSTIAQSNTVYLLPYAIAYLLISIVLYSNIIFNKSDLWKTSLVVLILLHFLTLIIIKLKAWQTQLGQESVVFRIKQEDSLLYDGKILIFLCGKKTLELFTFNITLCGRSIGGYK